MLTTRGFVRLGFMVVSAVMGSIGMTAPVAAQNSGIRTAAVATCNIRGSVALTVRGVTTVSPLTCANPTQRTAPGNDAKASTDTTSVGTSAMANLANVSGAYGRSLWEVHPQDVRATRLTVLMGRAQASSMRFLQDGIEVNDAAGWSRCSSLSGNSKLSCIFGTTLDSLVINGRAWPLPSPVPLNYPVALRNVPLRIEVLGRTVDMLMSGQVTLNKVSISGQSSPELRIVHAPIAVDVAGAATVSEVGTVQVRLNVENASETMLSGAHAMSAQTQADVGVWCIANTNASDVQLEVDKDVACASGADCSPLSFGGACYEPNTVYAHASYAINSFFQNHGQDWSLCDFGGTAHLTYSDPSTPGCPYPH